MNIRPGRTRSLIGGIMALVVMVIGLLMMSRAGGIGGGMLGPFMIVWVVIGLLGAGISFYNAFSEKGVPLYEIQTDSEGNGAFCPQCGEPVQASDQFCRHCGATLDA
jgi:ribosomal protein S27AE